MTLVNVLPSDEHKMLTRLLLSLLNLTSLLGLKVSR